MKRASFVVFGLVASCSGGADSVGETVDSSNDVGAASADSAGVDVSVGVDAGVDIGIDVQSETGTVDADAADAAVPDPCADAGVPPPTLACAGLYADFINKRVAGDAIEYTPATPLWSDGAQKQRWIVLPPKTQIDISNPNEWSFPVGTKLFKEFLVNGRRVETRMFQKVDRNFWDYATYAWSDDESSATINFGGPLSQGDSGVTWTIPTNDDCNECHRGRQDRILGFEQVSLGLPGAQGLTLARLAEMGLVTPAPAAVSLSIGDDGTGLDALALGWIHVNCGVTCHNSNPSAAGYGAGMDLRLDPAELDGTAPSVASWNILKTTIGVPCVSGSLIGQPRILPGDIEHSVIYELIDQRGALRMPPIASLVVDTTDVAVVASWIRLLGDAGGPPLADAGMSDGGGRRVNLDASPRNDSAADADDGNEQTPAGDVFDAPSSDAAPPAEDEAADAAGGDGGLQASDDSAAETPDGATTTAEDAADASIE